MMALLTPCLLQWPFRRIRACSPSPRAVFVCPACCCRQLYVRPLRSAGSVLLGWSFYLKAMGSPGWDTSDYVNVTLDMAMPYAGRGFRKQEGTYSARAAAGSMRGMKPQVVEASPPPT